MSDNTQTNLESLEAIKREAKRKGEQVTVHGQHVFVHPKSIRIPASAVDEDNPTSGKYGKYWVMWAMEW